MKRQIGQPQNLILSYFQTPLGKMIAVADEDSLYSLQFVNHSKLQIDLPEKKTAPIDLIEKELTQYFAHNLTEFKTPLYLSGSPFQKQVWEALQKIPFGTTTSYAKLACAIGKKTAFRAVAQANGANPFAIIIPCHRVIYANGALGGYNAGTERKEWLLNHEKSFRN